MVIPSGRGNIFQKVPQERRLVAISGEPEYAQTRRECRDQCGNVNGGYGSAVGGPTEQKGYPQTQIFEVVKFREQMDADMGELFVGVGIVGGEVVQVS